MNHSSVLMFKYMLFQVHNNNNLDIQVCWEKDKNKKEVLNYQSFSFA